MDNVNAINYTGFNYQCMGEEGTKENLRLMQKMTACNTVIIVLGAIQEEVDSTIVDYNHDNMPEDSDLVDFIRYAKQLGLKVILKPVINCQDGSCRSDIDFMKDGTVQKEAWEEWFNSYMEFILHYARIAEKTECEMFFVGCRLLKLISRDDKWRNLIKQVRACYRGKITYESNASHEQEITFWDSLDVISTSGNYSKSSFSKELGKLSELADSQKKEIYLTECGCMSTKGASFNPDLWDLDGMLSLEEQVGYFQTVFDSCSQHQCVKGIGIWCWSNRRQSRSCARLDRRYYIYGKPVCDYIYQEWRETRLIKTAM